jgi:hypothetical protein
MTQTATLEYGRESESRRRMRRMAVALLLAGLAAAAVGRFAYPTVAAKLSLFRAQRACMRYAAPPEQVVYDEFMERYAAYTGMEHFRPSLGSPLVWYASRMDPPQWAWLQGSVLGPAPPDTPLAFMHARRSPAGNQRLVVVELSGGVGDGHLFIVLCRVFRRPSLLSPLQLVNTQAPARVRTPDTLQTYIPFQHRDVRVFAGQPSPDDASAFTIEVETEGNRRTLTGRLLDDDTIAFDSGVGLTVEPFR